MLKCYSMEFGTPRRWSGFWPAGSTHMRRSVTSIVTIMMSRLSLGIQSGCFHLRPFARDDAAFPNPRLNCRLCQAAAVAIAVVPILLLCGHWLRRKLQSQRRQVWPNFFRSSQKCGNRPLFPHRVHVDKAPGQFNAVVQAPILKRSFHLLQRHASLWFVSHSSTASLTTLLTLPPPPKRLPDLSLRAKTGPKCNRNHHRSGRQKQRKR